MRPTVRRRRPNVAPLSNDVLPAREEASSAPPNVPVKNTFIEFRESRGEVAQRPWTTPAALAPCIRPALWSSSASHSAHSPTIIHGSTRSYRTASSTYSPMRCAPLSTPLGTPSSVSSAQWVRHVPATCPAGYAGQLQHGPSLHPRIPVGTAITTAMPLAPAVAPTAVQQGSGSPTSGGPAPSPTGKSTSLRVVRSEVLTKQAVLMQQPREQPRQELPRERPMAAPEARPPLLHTAYAAPRYDAYGMAAASAISAPNTVLPAVILPKPVPVEPPKPKVNQFSYCIGQRQDNQEPEERAVS